MEKMKPKGGKNLALLFAGLGGLWSLYNYA